MYESDQFKYTDDTSSKTDSVPHNLLKNKQPRTKRNKIHTMIKTINGGRDKKVKITITMYNTGEFGSFIRNAVTGEVTKHRVGTKDENQYFKVINATGLDRLHGPLQLYYDSPSQYELHQFVTLHPDVKDTWYERFNT